MRREEGAEELIDGEFNRCWNLLRGFKLDEALVVGRSLAPAPTFNDPNRRSKLSTPSAYC